ncbi:acyl-CoA dehydrogenase family protein [Mycobacterium kyogaense]|uniref:acyl-CoA dehydrogenase family protein n=1 Tax=Mycobacterium kyogaense TaxID=2212479 RepID=UPI000DADFE06|nr:acyl-CoA dehydrogenase family protein [Mycobacterium kyogaense]
MSELADEATSLADFDSSVRQWFQAQGVVPRTPSATRVWGQGSDDVSVFDDVDDAELADRLAAMAAWQRAKFDAGYVDSLGAAEHPTPLPQRLLRRYRELEAEYEVPEAGELPVVSIALIAPTIAALGHADQRKRFLRPLLRMEEVACQLFSEPDAGSDLAGVQTRAARDGDAWLLNGRKVWTSGARFAQWGLAIARSEPGSDRHHGLTAFLVPLDADGVVIRPIRQITGGTSFNEVFLDEVRVPDDLRLGDVGAGWTVAMTVLAFERDHSTGGGHSAGGQFSDVLAAARHFGRTDDPMIRDALADLFIHARIEELTNQRAAAKAQHGAAPGAEGSISKLLWTQNMSRISVVAAKVLGERLIADTEEWGTFAWTSHLLGAPGYRIAGGTDEIQRNILAERILGLPREPRPS